MTPPEDSPTAEIRTLGGVVVARLLDKRVLGLRSAALFEEVLFPRARTMGPRKLVLDLTDVSYLGSDSFGRIARLAATLRDQDGELALCGVAPGIRAAMRVTRLDTTCEIFDDLAAALGADRPTDPG